MYIQTALVLGLAAGALGAPTTLHKRAKVLQERPYADFQISDGKAGNALAEVMQKFPIDMSDLASVDPADADIISAARETAESAETDAFNPAIEAAGEESAEGQALQNGKIKNKVLKLQLEVMDLMIAAAQRGDDNADKIAEEMTKLKTNIGLDKEAAGEASSAVEFDG